MLPNNPKQSPEQSPEQSVPHAVVISNEALDCEHLQYVLDATKEGREIYVLSAAGVLTPEDIWDIIDEAADIVRRDLAQ